MLRPSDQLRIAGIFFTVVVAHAWIFLSTQLSGLSSVETLGNSRQLLEFRQVQTPVAVSPQLSPANIPISPESVPTVPVLKNAVAEQPNLKTEITSAIAGAISAPDLFLTLDQIDQSAEPLSDLGVTLGRIFPLFSGLVVLELWIDDQGRVLHVVVLQGRSLNSDSFDFVELLETPFKPAIKNGQTVASRKVIEINTDFQYIF